MEGLKKLYNWLCDKVEDKDICVEERVTYSKVLDYIERNISTKYRFNRKNIKSNSNENSFI